MRPHDEPLAPLRERIDSALSSLLPVHQPQALSEAMRYSALDGGKRLRPLLCLFACEACGGHESDAMPTACAIEMIHAFSLIHDDLPALDNDELRRGRPTCHVQFGEAIAILAGDALLAQAFEILAANPAQLPPSTAMEILRTIARASGTQGMVGGQVQDILAEGGEPDQASLEYIHTHKTGALIQASVMSGALAAGADQHQKDCLAAYGSALGHCFQIVDDILNETGDPSRTGKATGSDQQRAKLTYPRVFGLEASRSAAAQYANKAKTAIGDFDSDANRLRQMVDYVLTRDR